MSKKSSTFALAFGKEVLNEKLGRLRKHIGLLD